MKELLSISNSLTEEEQESIELFVEKKAIEQLYRNGLRAIPFNIINPLVLTVIFVLQKTHIFIYIWLALHILVSILRYAHILKRLPALSEEQSVSTRYLKEFIAAASVSALIWGTGFYFLSPLVSAVNQVIFLLVLAGMAAGAYASMSTHRLTYAAYLLSIFVPVIITLFTSSTTAISGNLLSLFIVAFVAMLLVTHKLSNTLIMNSIRSEIVKNILMQKLQDSGSN
jgi:hypothetical protein